MNNIEQNNKEGLELEAEKFDAAPVRVGTLNNCLGAIKAPKPNSPEYKEEILTLYEKEYEKNCK